MGCYLGLDKIDEASVELVGYKAKIYYELSKTLTTPFTLVITSEAFTEFIKHNNLSEIIQRALYKKDIRSRIQAFVQLSDPSALTSLWSSAWRRRGCRPVGIL